MVRPIVKDPVFLSQKCEPATQEDIPVGHDLQDTLKAHEENCVGMAANMIGVQKNIIIACLGIVNLVMFNPEITRKEKPFEAEEGCLCHSGVRKATRYEVIDVKYMDLAWKPHHVCFRGGAAQIIQHEIDHCNGVLI